MGVAKVILNNETLIDVTQKTVTSSNLLSGITALGRDGEPVVGSYIPPVVPMYQSKTITPTTSTQVVVPDTNMESLNGSGTVDRVSGISISHGGDLSGLVSGQSYRIAVTLNCYKMGSSYSATWSVDDEFEWNGSYFDLTSTAPSSIANVYLTSLRLTATTCDFYFASSGSHGADINGGIYISQPYDALSSVTVNPIPSDYVIPAGTLSVLADGTYDVKSYASVSVSVGGGGGIEGNLKAFSIYDYDFLTPGSKSIPLSNRFEIGESVAFLWQHGYYNGTTLIPDQGSFYSIFEYDGTSKTFEYSYVGAGSRTYIDVLTFDSSKFYYSCSTAGAFQLDIYRHGEFDAIDLFAGNNLSVYSSPSVYFIKSSFAQSDPTLTEIYLDRCVSIGFQAFGSCSNLINASLPKCEYIESRAFQYCYKLQSVYIPNVITIGLSAFFACSKLFAIDIPNATYISTGAFMSCRRLASVNAPLVSMVLSNAFNYCTSLQAIDLPSAVSIYSSTFYFCSQLSTVNLPLAKAIGTRAFMSCFSLASINMPEVKSIDGSAFYNCSALTSLYLPKLTSISTEVFIGCVSLETFTAPLVSYIGQSAFRGCSKLQSVSFPLISSIPASTFYGCSNLLSVYLMSGSVVSLANVSVFTGTPISSPIINNDTNTATFGSIYVPSSLYSSYLTAANWSTYSSRIVSM